MPIEEDSSHDKIPELGEGIPEDALYETYVDKESGVLIPKKFQNFEQFLVVSLLRENRRNEIARQKRYSEQMTSLFEAVRAVIPSLISSLLSRSVAQYPIFHSSPSTQPSSGPVPTSSGPGSIQ